ncbi:MULTISPECIES: Stk1 family PASTA domain-containing Ser/Thr kinase [Mogibacterium]|jgi:Serine/threonine protein kinase|uniref:non-specific serine/threonine protein kinase n=2 Tax=Mogibacterium timidum TaxID=35519 RepID=X8IUQ1_9FIRM|nr:MULTISPECIES: Stk1 family PASTA domain-containing Ser/Thr kinase [Mogibacterium]EUC52751.1 kinase domain protein [Mogibacterium timidum ATCC 33093]NWO23908.1 Stk1 family PASTA domain-containing Ser/Thr kinase [Mogibacterium timidum]
MSSRLLSGRYELLEKIGDGGMAVVYKGKDRLLNRFIAIKILRPEFTKDASFVENFKRESQAAAGLSHPNIVSVYDVGKEGNINYIVMELVEGKNLSTIIAEEAPLDYRRVIDLTKQVASALRIAHKNKIIHRDVKPHNIMVTSDGVAKLADFGIAKAVNDATLSTNSKVIGSVHYFSPEQARGNYVDERSDIYSLGIVMYEMLTGRVPFDGDNPVSIALKHINEEIVPPHEYVDGIPPALERAVLKATNKFQTNRFNSADELIEELDNIEFVTKVVGNSIFAEASNEVARKRSDLEDPSEDEELLSNRKGKKAKKNKKQGNSSRKKKIIRIALALAAILLIALGVAFATGKFSGKAKVPDLSDMTYKEAKKAADDAGFKIEKGKAVYSSEISEGHVVEQNPAGGEEAKKGSTIKVNLSKGSKDGTVPNLVGQNYKKVEKDLKKAGYKLGIVKSETSTKPEGTILSQDPAAGSNADKGTKINITISDGKGKDKGTVPSVTGKSLEEAKAAIRNAGFSVGNITYDESNVYGNGYVMWQQYAANTSLEKGQTIDIEVSKGAPSSGGGSSGSSGGSSGTKL